MATQEIIIRVVVETPSPAPASASGFKEVGERSPSQQLRLAFYALWKSKGSEGDFEEYYKGRIAVIIKTIEKQI